MAEQPSKRRKTSPDTYLPSGEHEIGQQRDNPTTPTRRRASYLSPTKASLARSHPKVLAKSPGRSLTEPRGRLLRQQLLGQQDINETEAFKASESIPKPPHSTDAEDYREDQQEATRSRIDGFAATIAGAFADVSIPNQKATADMLHSHSRSPLRARQSSTPSDTSRSRFASGSSLPEFIKPRLVSRTDTSVTKESKQSNNEPDLPPTPVQLGLDRPPERPRGLMSSSSAGSRSGSGKRRQRVRPGMSAVTSSPLKPKDPRPEPAPSFPTEAPESEIEATEEEEEEIEESRPKKNTSRAEESARIGNKIHEIGFLEIDRDILQREVESLELLATNFEESSSFEASREDIAILDEYLKTTGSSSLILNNIGVHTKAHQTLFAPGNLQLSHTTVSRHRYGATNLVQKLTITAPSPWPSDVFCLSFHVVVDVKHAKIDSIVQVRPGHFYRHSILQTWIERRLEHPLHSCDIGGLIQGAGHYFEACIERARTFKRLSQRYGNEPVYSNDGGLLSSITSREALILSHFLDQDQIILTSTAKDAAAQGHKWSQKSIILVYELALTWTGTVRSLLDISTTGMNSKAQQGAKELFGKLLPLQGVDRAFDSIWNLLSSGEQDQGEIGAVKASQKNKRPLSTV